MRSIQLFSVKNVARMRSIVKEIIDLGIMPAMEEYLTDDDIREELHIFRYGPEE